MVRRFGLLLVLGLTACGDAANGEPSDTILADAEALAELMDDTGENPPSDTLAAAETALPLPGFGVITGACGVLLDELSAPTPSLFVNHLDFGDDPYDATDLDRLTDGGREILHDGNAGGSSILSEVFAFELLARCEGAELLKTETEISYDTPAKITDMVLLIHGQKIGANPTRAIGFPFDAPYTVEQAKRILEKKLGDINSSSATVSAEDRWVKQILTVFAYAEAHAVSVTSAWQAIDPALKADTIVLVTVTDGSDGFIYSDQ